MKVYFAVGQRIRRPGLQFWLLYSLAVKCTKFAFEAEFSYLKCMILFAMIISHRYGEI